MRARARATSRGAHDRQRHVVHRIVKFDRIAKYLSRSHILKESAQTTRDRFIKGQIPVEQRLIKRLLPVVQEMRALEQIDAFEPLTRLLDAVFSSAIG